MESSMINKTSSVPDKSLLFEAPEFLAAPCQVTCKQVQILTFHDPQLWTGQFIANLSYITHVSPFVDACLFLPAFGLFPTSKRNSPCVMAP